MNEQQMIERISQLESEIAELRVKAAEWDAVPLDDIQRMQGCEAHTEGTELAKVNVRIWLERRHKRFGIWPEVKNADGWYDPTGYRFIR